MELPLQTIHYDHNNLPNPSQKHAIAAFLFQHLGQYGDPLEDIEKAIDYALGVDGKIGGHLTVLYHHNEIASAVVINKTGMSGYIPENILVYIATHQDLRGQGLGKKIIKEVLDYTQGDIALHVEPDNPAKRLYERLGFTNKYLEMRLTSKA